MQIERKANSIIEDSMAYRNSLNVLKKETTEKFISLSVKAVLKDKLTYAQEKKF